MDPSDSAAQEIDFSSFIVSLATSALMHLGEIQAEGQPPQVNLTLARQTIDIIGMLREKTRGNLTEAETQMVEDVLYDLRIKYLAARKGAS